MDGGVEEDDASEVVQDDDEVEHREDGAGEGRAVICISEANPFEMQNKYKRSWRR